MRVVEHVQVVVARPVDHSRLRVVSNRSGIGIVILTPIQARVVVARAIASAISVRIRIAVVLVENRPACAVAYFHSRVAVVV